jgi:hypothetical protein
MVHISEPDLKQKFLVTAADDNRLIAYDSVTKKALCEGIVMIS